ncbi:hypothetical protein HZS_5271, partial [Henneguya salminicola]
KKLYNWEKFSPFLFSHCFIFSVWLSFRVFCINTIARVILTEIQNRIEYYPPLISHLAIEPLSRSVIETSVYFSSLGGLVATNGYRYSLFIHKAILYKQLSSYKKYNLEQRLELYYPFMIITSITEWGIVVVIWLNTLLCYFEARPAKRAYYKAVCTIFNLTKKSENRVGRKHNPTDILLHTSESIILK